MFANIMKCFFVICILSLTLTAISQNNQIKGYNFKIIDSCISKIDTSYKVLQILFVNGQDLKFEQILIDTLTTLKHIKHFLYNYSPDVGGFYTLRGVSIRIYYESISCVVNSGEFTFDNLTGETSEAITNNDAYYCWTFKAGESIKPCK